jgi:nucleotide-binding universal stress UspA family protein
MRILVATDGSTEAAEAVEWATHLPLPADTQVEVVNAVPWPLLDQRVSKAAPEFRKRAETVVEDARARIAKRWPAVSTRILDGDPRDAVIEAAWTSQADLIVVGARGLGAVASFLLGRVSLGIARHAPCPVLVCRGAPRPVRAVTVALDGSEDSRVALRYVAGWPLPADSTLHLVGVVEPMRYPASAPEMISDALITAMQEYEDERTREIAQVLTAAAAELRPRVAAVSTATPVGSPAPAIVREAEQVKSDLLVVGARGLGHLKRMLLGSVSESVLRHAACPVLIVRRRG